MEIPRLNVLCMANITKHIWYIHDPTKLLIAYFRITGGGYFPWSQTQTIPFVCQLESITEKISGITYVPKQLRTNISMMYLNLVMDIMDWFAALHKCVDFFDLVYVMEKIVFTSTGKVDRPCTIVRVLFDTYGNIHIRHHFIRYCCLITPAIVDDYVKSNKYITNRILIQKIKKKVLKMKINDNMEPEHLRMKLSVHGAVELLQHYHNSIKDSEKSKWLCEVTSHMIQSMKKNYFTDKIIYVYHNIDYGTWLKILSKEYLSIIKEFFHDGPSEYCLLFYKQIIRSKPDTNIYILKVLIQEITNLRFNFCYNAFKEFQKDIFLRIWDITPDNVKTNFLKKPYFYDGLAFMFCNFHNYDIISTFIKDQILSEEERKDLINLLILSHKSNEDCNYKSHLNRLYNDFDIECANYDEIALKNFVLHGSQKLFALKIFDNIFEDKEQMISFKKKISTDHQFLIEVISNFDSEFPHVSSVIDLLDWCYPDQQEAITFVKEHLLNTNVMIHIYCDYLNRSVRMTNCKKNIFDMIFNNESVQLACELRTKINDPSFFKKTLNVLFTNGNYKSLSCYLKNIYDEIEIKEIVESYLLSESGIIDVLDKFIHTECASESIVFEHKVKETIKENFKFKKYWLKQFDLVDSFCQYISENSKLIYQEHFKVPQENNMLPYESIQQFKTIVNARYIIFMSMMMKNVSDALVDELLYSPFIISLSHIADCVSEDLHIDNLIDDSYIL